MRILVMEKKKINKEVWEILNEDERVALSLSLGYGKSTWESGEIMSRAHFKYLEIQKRAKKFLEIFTIHLEKYKGLFPENLLLPFHFKEYLYLTMIERMNISKTIKSMEDQNYSVASVRNRMIIKEIKRLQKDKKEEAADLYSLIMDFDRWNNFRILPREIQEPSAFKRRNKARNVKHLKNITNLPQYSLDKLVEKFSYKGKFRKIYLPLISDLYKKGYKIISIKDNNKNRKVLTNIGLFIFADPTKSEEFARLVSDYFLNTIRTCKLGQKFWPEFRILMGYALNQKELENIYKSRTYLDKAFFDLDKRRYNKRKGKEYEGERRADNEKIFYPSKK